MSSIRNLANATGFSRDAITTRVKRWNLGDDFDPKAVLTLRPLEDDGTGGISLAEARTLESMEKTALLKIQRQRLEGKLADVEEISAAMVAVFGTMGKIVKASKLDDDAKGDLLGSMNDCVRKWAEGGGRGGE